MAGRGVIAGVLLLTLQCSWLASACVFMYGTSPDSLAKHDNGTHWNHSLSGDDWTGVDKTGKPWMCMTGTRQSPIILPPANSLDATTTTIPSKLRSQWYYPDLVSNGSNIEVINNGHTIQVEWLSPYNGEMKVAIPAARPYNSKITSVLGMTGAENHTYVSAKPAQFHFHTASEHLIGGRYFPLEMHIVHKIAAGRGCPGTGSTCYSVTGVLFELVQGPNNPLLEAIWAAMPSREGTINYLPEGARISLDQLLPRPGAREYVTYEGSLTTPPCTEGLLWQVMTRPQTISVAQWRAYKEAVGLKECTKKNATEVAETDHRRHHHRHMLSTEEVEVNPNDYECKVTAYGSNFRTAQPINDRTVKLAKVA